MARSEGNELEARLYEHLKAQYLFADAGDYETIEYLVKALDVTADELQPIIERGVARKRLAHKWKAGVKLISLMTPAYEAAMVEAKQRADAALAEEFSNEPWARTTPKAKRPHGRPRGRTAKRESRLAPLGPYAPVPRAIAKDPSVSLAARGFALLIADLINLAPWNTDLHVDASYRTLAERTGVSLSNLKRLVAELR